MPEPRETALRPLVVTGTAHSGSAYLASVLGGLGLRFGHEVVFGPRTTRFTGWQGQHGDASWLAVPFLDEVPEALVLHLTRHPLDVLRSLVGVRFLADRHPAVLVGDDLYTRVKWAVRGRLLELGHVEASTKGPRPHHLYRSFVARHVPEALVPDDLVTRTLAYWARWTERLLTRGDEDRYLRRRVEELDEFVVCDLLRRMGLEVDQGLVAIAMSKVQRDADARRVAPLQWFAVPDSPLKDRAQALAADLGYDLTRPRLPFTPPTA